MDIFILRDSQGNLLPPAVQSTVLAKYSRSPLSARQIVETLTPEEADKFQDKWFVQFGHSSVSELATFPICFENVSIVASKFLESFQRPGYSEKSTRYQKFSADSFILPPGAPESMKTFVRRLYETYDRLLPRVVRRCAELMGKNPDDPEVLKDRTVKARAFDNVRYLLPAGTGTNLGIVGNGRDFKYLVRSALGHQNPEIREIGEQTKKAIEEIFPVLMKGVTPDSFELPIQSLGSLPNEFDRIKPSWNVSLYRPHLLPDPNLVQKSFESMVVERLGMSWSAFCNYMEERGERSVPKIFRNFRLQFDIMMDYGAFRDLQRHRRCEQYPEFLATHYGYLVPDDIIGTDMETEYRAAMDSVQAYADDCIYDQNLMQYIIPLGYLHRTVFDMDLESVYYITELRSRPAGHISYRRVAYKMFELAKERYPQLLQWCRVVKPDFIGAHT
jgi:thymidylate synthase ThyX